MCAGCLPDHFGPAPDDLHVHVTGAVRMWDEVDLRELGLHGWNTEASGTHISDGIYNKNPINIENDLWPLNNNFYSDPPWVLCIQSDLPWGCSSDIMHNPQTSKHNASSTRRHGNHTLCQSNRARMPGFGVVASTVRLSLWVTSTKSCLLRCVFLSPRWGLRL